MHTHPASAVKVVFKPLGGMRRFRYFVWQSINGNWYWEARGNCGYASSEQDACRQARNWITDGLSSIKRESRPLLSEVN